MSVCSASSYEDVPCDSPAVVRVVVGCVHEHVRTIRHCAFHWQYSLDGNMRCRPCLQHPTHGHECVSVPIKTLEHLTA
jgi:hypothetical protein